MLKYPSVLIGNAVAAFSKLPGIGEKTALRLVLHLLKQDPEKAEAFSQAISVMRKDIRFCSRCHGVSDYEICNVCSNNSRDHSVVCVVESIREVIAIENTSVFNGVYHVLGGLISPVDGVGPDQLQAQSLFKRVETGEIREVIMALSPTIEGDTTIFYLSRKLRDFSVQITSIARGVSFGGELEYADELTLAKSISSRLPFESYLVKNA